MDKKDFFDLLNKYSRNDCSQKEKEVLFEFIEKLQSTRETIDWDISKKEEARIRILHRIYKTIETEEGASRPRVLWPRLAKVSSFVLVLLVLGYGLYSKYFIGQDSVVNEDAITLRLDDGSIEVIDEGDEQTIFDEKGNVIGHQKGGELVYNGNMESCSSKINVLTVPFGKTFMLKLSDGTTVHLNAGSSISYPVSFKENTVRRVSVVGEALLDVAKDQNSPFEVMVEDLNVRVLGTVFNVHAYPEDFATEVVLVEGAVDLYVNGKDYNPDTSMHLEPGHKASLAKIDGSLVKERVSANIYTSWVDGELVFRNMTFANILKKLERHFNVSITNGNHGLMDQKFNASFGAEPSLVEVLDEFRQTFGIEYHISDDHITIK